MHKPSIPLQLLSVVLAAKQHIVFIQELQDVTAKEKDSMATFECETSEPFVKVQWYKDGIEIFSGDKYRTHSDRKGHFLSILMIDKFDEDDYSCALVEDESVKTTGKLIVEGKDRNCFNTCFFAIISLYRNEIRAALFNGSFSIKSFQPIILSCSQ
uniref:Ig-like domain-containing protein n=1 Tax=Laticauda laticaudata TaxID=8630 RepID=A0A8C5RZC2_LATLA